MINFQVPQFIEIEDKIFGPLSFKQFVYVAGGGGLAFMFWIYLPFRWLAVIFIVPVVVLALALAFYKVNNRPFILVLESAFRYALMHKLYIWKHAEPASAKAGQAVLPPTGVPKGLIVPKLSDSKLKDLAWSLDIREKV